MLHCNCGDLIVILTAICLGSYWLAIGAVGVCVVFGVFHRRYSRSFVEMQRIEGMTRTPMFVHFDQTLAGLSTIRNYYGEKQQTEAMMQKMKSNIVSYYTLEMGKH